MSDLQSLAGKKADAHLQRRIQEVPGAVQALQRKLAAQGLLQSGAMLKQVLATSKEGLQAQGATTITEYRWAITQSLFASQSWVEHLIAEATVSLEPLYNAYAEQITKAVSVAGVPDVAARLMAELDQSHSSTKNEIALALRSAFAEKRRGLLRVLPSAVYRLVAKLLGGGHP